MVWEVGSPWRLWMKHQGQGLGGGVTLESLDI